MKKEIEPPQWTRGSGGKEEDLHLGSTENGTNRRGRNEPHVALGKRDLGGIGLSPLRGDFLFGWKWKFPGTWSASIYEDEVVPPTGRLNQKNEREASINQLSGLAPRNEVESDSCSPFNSFSIENLWWRIRLRRTEHGPYIRTSQLLFIKIWIKKKGDKSLRTKERDRRLRTPTARSNRRSSLDLPPECMRLTLHQGNSSRDHQSKRFRNSFILQQS